MATPVSSATSYASPADLLTVYSAAKIGGWAANSGAPAVKAPDIPTDPNVLAALLRASGEVEMACFRGGRYSPTDLATLTGASAAALKGLVCDLAYYHLAGRIIPHPEEQTQYKRATELLQALNDGAIIFGLQEAANAGNPVSIDLKYDSRGRERRMTSRFHRLFGSREGDRED